MGAFVLRPGRVGVLDPETVRAPPSARRAATWARRLSPARRRPRRGPASASPSAQSITASPIQARRSASSMTASSAASRSPVSDPNLRAARRVRSARSCSRPRSRPCSRPLACCSAARSAARFSANSSIRSGQQRSHLFQISRFLKPPQHAGQARLRRGQPASLHHLARPLRERTSSGSHGAAREQRAKTPQQPAPAPSTDPLLQRDLRRHNVVLGKVLHPLRVLVQQQVALARLERRKARANRGDDIAHLVRRRPTSVAR